MRLSMVVTTQTLEAKTIISRHLARLRWLKNELRAQKVDLHVILDDFKPAGGPRLRVALSEHSKEVSLDIAPYTNTLCGTKVDFPATAQGPSSTCTLGGIFRVGDEYLAQSAWHPQAKSLWLCDGASKSHCDADDGSQLVDPDSPFSILYDDNSDDADEFQVEECGPRQRAVDYAKNSPLLDEDRTSATMHHSQCSTTPTTADTVRLDAANRRYESSKADWCMFDLPKAKNGSRLKSLIQNRVDDCLITDIYQGNSNVSFPITVSTPNGEVPGWWRPETVRYRIGSHSYDLSLIEVDRPLQAGCSGAWVTRGNQLCGMVVVVSETVPWAYIMPAKTMFADMEAICGQPVRLPGPGDTIGEFAKTQVLDDGIDQDQSYESTCYYALESRCPASHAGLSESEDWYAKQYREAYDQCKRLRRMLTSDMDSLAVLVALQLELLETLGCLLPQRAETWILNDVFPGLLSAYGFPAATKPTGIVLDRHLALGSLRADCLSNWRQLIRLAQRVNYNPLSDPMVRMTMSIVQAVTTMPVPTIHFKLATTSPPLSNVKLGRKTAQRLVEKGANHSDGHRQSTRRQCLRLLHSGMYSSLLMTLRMLEWMLPHPFDHQLRWISTYLHQHIQDHHRLTGTSPTSSLVLLKTSLSASCLSLNRLHHDGLPCSQDYTVFNRSSSQMVAPTEHPQLHQQETHWIRFYIYDGDLYGSLAWKPGNLMTHSTHSGTKQRQSRTAPIRSLMIPANILAVDSFRDPQQAVCRLEADSSYIEQWLNHLQMGLDGNYSVNLTDHQDKRLEESMNMSVPMKVEDCTDAGDRPTFKPTFLRPSATTWLNSGSGVYWVSGKV